MQPFPAQKPFLERAEGRGSHVPWLGSFAPVLRIRVPQMVDLTRSFQGLRTRDRPGCCLLAQEQVEVTDVLAVGSGSAGGPGASVGRGREGQRGPSYRAVISLQLEIQIIKGPIKSVGCLCSGPVLCCSTDTVCPSGPPVPRPALSLLSSCPSQDWKLPGMWPVCSGLLGSPHCLP